MEFVDENMVTESEQGVVPEVDSNEAHRKQQEGWEMDEEEIFGVPLLQPHPQSNGSILAGGESTSNELTPDAEQAIQDASGMSNDEYNCSANFDQSPINQDSSCYRNVDNDSSHGEINSENGSESSDVKEDAFDCQYCGQRWPKLVSLNKHIASKHKKERAERDALPDENLHRCTVSGCVSVFLSKEAAYNHFAYAHDQQASSTARSYSCRYCSKKYDVSSSLHSHYVRSHPNKPRVSIIEDRIAAGKGCHSEEQCDPATPKVGPRKKLASVEKPNGTRYHKCKYCTATFDRRDRNIAHQKKYHQKDMDESSEDERDEELASFPCKHTGCDRTFSTNKGLVSHTLRVHQDGKATPAKDEFLCDFCPKSYPTNSGLTLHKQRIHPEKMSSGLLSAEEFFFCPKCPKNYAKLTTLRTHIWRYHPGTPKLRAEELRRSGDCIWRSIRNELRRIHSSKTRIIRPCSDSSEDEEEKEEKVPMTRGRGRPPLAAKFKMGSPTPASNPLKCDMCRRSFATSDFLDKHQLTHAEFVSKDSKSKLFCDVCGQVFKGEPYVLRHKNTTPCGKKVSTPISSSSKEAQRNVHYTSSVGLGKRRSEAIIGNDVDDELAACRPSKLKQSFVIKKGQQYLTMNSNKSREEVNSTEDRCSSQYVSNTIVTHEGHVERKPSRMLPHKTAQAAFPTANSVKAELTWNSVVKYDDFNTNQLLPVSNLNNSERIDSLHSGNVQCSCFPLSTAIFQRAAQFPEEIMIAWSSVLDADMLAAANMNSANTILCVQELDSLHLPKEANEILLRGHIITLTMLTSNDTASQWTIITFGEKRPPVGLKNKLFTQFQNVENIFVQDAATRNMEVVNILRYAKAGFFPMLFKSFAKKTIVCNYQQ